ncbi:mannitol dehydrogenase family protein [Cetobacterium sp. 8H]|uniref:mannitol dehydrogenase family protein n=1 Tax=Cetobacterium sp. 8H TaxID=2759681 RepID=UPI0021065528|nr:mannitol dehydrogenase family protein [Cetobacterium sp. 8H]
MIRNITHPNFDIIKLKEKTSKSPKWLHFGAGNIFRGYMGKVQQTLLEKGLEDTGIIVAETFDGEIIEKVFNPYNNETVLVTLDKKGEFKSEIISSIVESIDATTDKNKRLEEICTNENLQIISFTITEKGYNLKNTKGLYLDVIEEDFKNGIKEPKHLMTKIAYLLYLRYKKNQAPISLLSMDNCSANGDKIKEAIEIIVNEWIKNSLVDKSFLDYLQNEKKVSYPITMIDKITPRPSLEIKEFLESLGLKNMDIIITKKNSFTAPFVNAEVPEYFVVEDKFPNGRPKFEEAGVILTNRELVEKVERMKVTTCLNPLHTTLAIYGCLLNKKSIADCMQDLELSTLVRKIGYKESLIVVEDPKIINPKKFLEEVLEERFSNPFIPDQPQRIATDTSQKVGIRFGETIKAYIENENLDVKRLRYIPLVIAGWMRYLMEVDDAGASMPLSSDPLLEELKESFKEIEYLNLSSYKKSSLDKILSNKDIFGVDLVQIGMAELIEEYFLEMIKEVGGVRNTLHKHLEIK